MYRHIYYLILINKTIYYINLFFSLFALFLFRLQVLKTHVINYSCLRYFYIFYTYVKMFIARRQYAWVKNKNFPTHQRLNKEYLNKDKLNKINPYNQIWFEQPYVEMTDGDGTLSIVRQNNKWSLAYKIAAG